MTVSLVLTEYALQRTPNAEEALLWHGCALYRKGDTAGAVPVSPGRLTITVDVNIVYEIQ